MSSQVINPYRFSVAEQVYESTTYINNDDNSDMQDMYNIRYANGIAIPSGSSLIGAKPTEIEFKAVKTGSPSGTIYGRIYSNATYYGGLGTLEEQSPTTYSTSSWTTGTSRTFDFAGTYALQANDAIAFWSDLSSYPTDANSITCRGYYSRATDNATQIQVEYNTTESWYRETSYNTWVKLTYK